MTCPQGGCDNAPPANVQRRAKMTCDIIQPVQQPVRRFRQHGPDMADSGGRAVAVQAHGMTVKYLRHIHRSDVPSCPAAAKPTIV
ncbi:hypothetical protein AA11826_1375 [Komagataeibacter oboediens DSM 11826]|nr:hypothetical protein AA11826_1375 [Komagataeibacter oboediens DSM 11826]